MKSAGYATASAGGLRPLLGNAFGKYITADPKRVKREGRNEQPVVTDQMFEWMARKRRKPFLAFLHYAGGHWPYWDKDPEGLLPFESCEGQDHSFKLQKYGTRQGKPGEGIVLTDPEAVQASFWSVDLGEKTRQHMIAHYDSEIRAMDALVGQLIARMRRGTARDHDRRGDLGSRRELRRAWLSAARTSRR